MKTSALAAFCALWCVNVFADPSDVADDPEGAVASAIEQPEENREIVVNLDEKHSQREQFCWREAALGTRILRKKCYFYDSETRTVLMDDQTERDEYELLRNRNAMREAEREQAFQQEMARRGQMLQRQ